MIRPVRRLSLSSGPRWSAEVRFTDAFDGDFAVDAPRDALDSRRSAVAPVPWTWLRQVHGGRVVSVGHPGEHAGESADGLVTDRAGVVLAVQTADCAPVAFVADNGIVGAAHAGWRGLVEGVLEATVGALRTLGATGLHAYLGPCIQPGCYEFGTEDLERVAASLGNQVRATTSAGRPALDLVGAVRTSLATCQVPLDTSLAACTACSDELFSYRAGGDHSRQSLAIWLDDQHRGSTGGPT